MLLRLARRRLCPNVLLLVCVLAASTPGCATLAPKPPPGLTPAAVSAFYGTQVIQDLDLARDFVHAGHQTTPPVFSAATDLIVVEWHQGAIRVIHETPNGWKPTVLKSFDELRAKLSPDDYARVRPYLDLATSLMQEVP